jgi:hypothetical protein
MMKNLKATVVALLAIGFAWSGPSVATAATKDYELKGFVECGLFNESPARLQMLVGSKSVDINYAVGSGLAGKDASYSVPYQSTGGTISVTQIKVTCQSDVFDQIVNTVPGFQFKKSATRHLCVNGGLSLFGCSPRLNFAGACYLSAYFGGTFLGAVELTFNPKDYVGATSLLLDKAGKTGWSKAVTAISCGLSQVPVVQKQPAPSIAQPAQQPSAAQQPQPVQQPVPQSATPAQPVSTVGSVIINSSYGACQYGSNCLIAGFSVSGFSPVPSVYTCIFSNGARYDFSLSGSSVGTACVTNESGDSITIEVGGVRSATISNNAPSNATPNSQVVNNPVTQTPVAQSPVVATPATPATPAVPAPVSGTSSPVLGTVSAAGRVGPCTFGSSCLIASFSIAGFSPQPTRYTCIFSDGSRYDFSFGGSSVNTACYTNARPDSITIEVAGVRSGFLANSTATPVAPVTPTPAPTSSVRTYTEQAGTAGSPTFLNPVNAGGPGQRIGAMAYVEVFCKFYAPQIASVNPDGYWYKVASAPWSGTYFAPANNFWNGDVPGVKPYVHNTDFAVPDC